MKTKSESIKIATIISYLSLIVSLLSTFFFTPFLLSKVGDDYGVFSLAESITSWLTIVSTAISASFVRFATRESAESDRETKKTNTIFIILMSIISLLSLIVGITIFALFKSGVLQNNSFTSSENSLFEKILILSVVQCSFEIIYSFFSSYVVFKKKFVPIRLVTLISAVLYPVISSILLLFFPHMLIVVLILYATRDIFQILLIIYSFSKLKVKFTKIDKKEFKVLFASVFSFSFFILINAFIDTINSTIDKLLLGFMIGSGVVTIYQLGMSFRIYLTSLSLALSNNYVPIVNDYAVKNDIDSINSLFFKIGFIQSILIWAIIGGFAACGQEFVTLWVGAEKKEVFFVALTLMLNVSFPLCENISIEYQRSLYKHKVRAILYFACALLNFVLTFLLLKFSNLNPFVSCLIGTVLSDFLGVWLIINIYNQKVLKLKVSKLLFGFLVVGSIALLSYFVSVLIGYLFKNQSLLILLIIKGASFLVSYVLFIYFIGFVLCHKAHNFLETLLPASLVKFFDKICFRNYQLFHFKMNKKTFLVSCMVSLILYAGCLISSFTVIGATDYKYDTKRYYIYFGESNFEDTSLILKIDCYMKDMSMQTVEASRIHSVSKKIDEMEDRILSFDAPYNAYGFSFRITYPEHENDWLKTNIFPVKNGMCFYLNFTSLDYYQNSNWFKPSFGLEGFSYYILPTIDLNSESNLNGVNCFGDLKDTFGRLFNNHKEEMKEYSWVDESTGDNIDAKTYLNYIRDKSVPNSRINPYKLICILFGSLLPPICAFPIFYWWKYGREK